MNTLQFKQMVNLSLLVYNIAGFFVVCSMGGKFLRSLDGSSQNTRQHWNTIFFLYESVNLHPKLAWCSEPFHDF